MKNTEKLANKINQEIKDKYENMKKMTELGLDFNAAKELEQVVEMIRELEVSKRL